MAVAVVAGLALAGSGLAAPSSTSTDLRISIGDTPDPVSVGTTLTYAIQVANLGPNGATGVVVTDQLPKGVDLVSATANAGTCAGKGRAVTCNLGGIGFGTVEYGANPASVTLTVIPRRVGPIADTASVKAVQKDPLGADNKATATTLVLGPPATCRGVTATIVGSARDDLITGTGGPDVIAALGGNDTIAAKGGRDLVCAGSGRDSIAAGSAADRVFGGAGADQLLGRGGPDLLRGNAGNDVLRGGRGSDRLRGGPGSDRCVGGPGADSIRGC